MLLIFIFALEHQDDDKHAPSIALIAGYILTLSAFRSNLASDVNRVFDLVLLMAYFRKVGLK